MKSLVIVSLIACMMTCASALFVRPSVYGIPSASKDVCFDSAVSTSNELSFLECANEGLLHIESCEFHLATIKECPLLFTGSTNGNNVPSQCSAPKFTANSDCTTALVNLCNTKTKCVFNWNQLPNLQCIDPAASALADARVDVPETDQYFTVKYRCQNKRNSFRPFGNKRYSFKFTRNMQNPLRKLSYNRLQQL